MDVIGEEKKSPGVDKVVHSDESLPVSKEDETKATYKSFKKKYRKMKLKFDETMRLSNELYIQEQNAEATTRRIAQENDQLLDLLLDVNNSAQIPADKRIDLNMETPFLATIPDLITKEELAQAAEINTPAGQAIYNSMRALLEEKAAERAAARPPKSLAHLMATTPHQASNSPLVSRDLLASFTPPEGSSHPIGYLTPDLIDDYCYDIDATLGNIPVPPNLSPPSPQQEVMLRNPNSVYNWLRKNEPKIFLQDGEGSEKSNGKPGSLRGAGKRASMPAPSKPDALEIVEEDGLGYDPTISGLEPAKGKRKREDDGGYHPKLGAPDGKAKRPRPKKKKVDGSAESTPVAKKVKTKGRNSGDNIVVEDPSLPSEA